MELRNQEQLLGELEDLVAQLHSRRAQDDTFDSEVIGWANGLPIEERPALYAALRRWLLPDPNGWRQTQVVNIAAALRSHELLAAAISTAQSSHATDMFLPLSLISVAREWPHPMLVEFVDRLANEFTRRGGEVLRAAAVTRCYLERHDKVRACLGAVLRTARHHGPNDAKETARWIDTVFCASGLLDGIHNLFTPDEVRRVVGLPWHAGDRSTTGRSHG
jgi:phytoene dehydrogenase-like protein